MFVCLCMCSVWCVRACVCVGNCEWCNCWACAALCWCRRKCFQMSLLNSQSWHPIPPELPQAPPFLPLLLLCLIIHFPISPACWWSTQRKCIPSCLLIGVRATCPLFSSPWPNYIQLLTLWVCNFFLLYILGFSCVVNTHSFCVSHYRRKKRSICCRWITWSSEMWRKVSCPQNTSSQSSTPNRGQGYIVRLRCHSDLLKEWK